jgi:TniQ/Bacterial regulatory helix-turn-helix protein, lysR family
MPGEAIDSWLEAIANRCDIPWADLRLALGAVLPSSSYSDEWILRLTDAQAAEIGAATEIDAAALRSMTLEDYPAVAIGVDPRTGRSASPFPWRHIHATRFCPGCLADNGGRWKLTWRMVWFFACPTHRCLLADVCPTCGAAQRRLRMSAHVPQPGRCAAPRAESGTSGESRCGADLTRARVTRLDPASPVLAAQAAIIEALVTGTVDFGIYQTFPYRAAQLLVDIRALGKFFLSTMDPQVLISLGVPDRIAEHHELPPPARMPAWRVRDRSSPAVSIAVAATAALAILGQSDIASAAEVMRGTRLSDTKGSLFTPIITTRSAGWQASSALRAVYLSALEPRLGTPDHLRCRLGTPLPHRPCRDMVRAARRAHQIPAMFWPEWSLRLADPRHSQRQLRPALSVALLLVGIDLRVGQAIELLDCELNTQAVVTVLRNLRGSEHWDDLRTALYRLSDYLENTSAPIDYLRRQRLSYSGLLAPRQWAAICRATRTHPAGASTARTYLRERLSMQAAFASPVPDSLASAYSSLLRFPVRLTPELSETLTSRALDFLAVQGITDEPVQWQPPTELLSGLRLPGKDPDDVDIDLLHALIRRGGLSLGAAADRLETTIDAVRLCLEKHPAPRPRRQPTRPRVTARRMGPAYQKASSMLSRERLIELYEIEGRSLRDIAAMVGVCGPTVAELARDYGIAVRKAGRGKYRIDPEWLHDQYITHGRSLSELARERHISISVIVKCARDSGIPLRRLSRYSPTTLSTQNNVPKMLVPALATQGGWERLQRLTVIAHHTSLAAAESDLGVRHATLGLQIRRIERDLGGAVLVRATGLRPLRLTPLGKRAVAGVNDLIARGGP